MTEKRLAKRSGNGCDRRRRRTAMPGVLNHGKAMWGAVVDRNGQLCALAVSTEDMAVTWPGSRGIAIAKASTSNAFSSDTLR